MTPIRTASTLALAEEWSLVLEAEGYTPQIRRLGEEFVIFVPSSDANRALRALWAYESENSAAASPDKAEWSGLGPLLTGIGIAAAIVLFYFISTTTEPEFRWYERGRASADLILNGELWRTVTALTLHADFAHAMSNAIASAFFVTLVGTVVGPGLGAALTLATGAGGNFLNALLQSSSHTSVGASTAIFGIVGSLGGIGFTRRRRQVGHRGSWLPLAASVAILAMIGTSGMRVDLWAHLWGLTVGAAAGIALAMFTDLPPPLEAQRKLGVIVIVVILLSWLMAFA